MTYDEYPVVGITFWGVAFPLIAYALLNFIKRKLSRNSNLAFWIGGCLALACYLVIGLVVIVSGRSDIPVCGFLAQVIKVVLSHWLG